jgi:hypothetical protein
MYAHSKQELRSTGAFHKTKLCRFMQTGHCTLGAKCNFAHSAVELREPETIEGVEPPPGLGWESMVSDLLSEDDEDAYNALPDYAPAGYHAKQAAGFEKHAKKVADKDVKSERPLPAYVPLAPSADSWTTEFLAAARAAEEKKAHQEHPAALDTFKQDVGMESFWDAQNLIASSDSMCYPDMGFQGSNLAYGDAFNEFASPWAGGLLIEQYASLMGSAWDWQLFGDSAVIDQKEELKMKSEMMAPGMSYWQQGGEFVQ